MKLGLNTLGLSNTSGGGGAASPYLDGVVASTVFDLSADQYTSGETWENLCLTCADGSSPSAYNFYLGEAATTDGDEPTHSTNKWQFDGIDQMFRLAGSNTSFLNNLHNEQDFSIAVAWNNKDTAWPTDYLFATYDGTNGIAVLAGATERMALDITCGGTLRQAFFTNIASPKNGPHIAIFSHDASANESYLWFDSFSKETLVHNPVSSTGSPSAAAVIGVNQVAGMTNYIGADYELHAIAAFNAVLSDADAAAIKSHWASRLSVSFP